MTRFQLIFTGVLVAIGIAGVAAFAFTKSSSNQGAVHVTLWGTLPGSLVSGFIGKITQDNPSALSVGYVEKSPASLEGDLVAALARGQGPDMVLLPQDLVLKQLDKFYVLPYSTFSERVFKDTFVQEGELYLSPDGVIAMPFAIDPMVMYWNRDLFASAGVAEPPTAWTELFDIAPKLTAKSSDGTISQSAVAMGETRNVAHYKDVIALLALQAGTPIVARDSQGTLASVFGDRSAGLSPAEEAVSFYTEFSNPIKDSYTWNRSLPTDRNAFAGGSLAMYFGYASELGSIRDANPNLNFDVALVPQTEGKKATFGNIYALAILKSSRNVAAAYSAATTLIGQPAQKEWVSESGLPPVRRDMLSPLPGDAYQAIFYQSSLIANAWLDPDREGTDQAFSSLVDSVTSGRLRVSEAVTQANAQIEGLVSADIQQ